MPPTVKTKKIVEICTKMVYLLYYEMEATTSGDTFLKEDEETRLLPTQPKLKKKNPNAKAKESQVVSSEKDNGS